MGGEQSGLTRVGFLVRSPEMGDVGGDKGQDKHKAPAPLHTATCPYRKKATFPKNLPL